MVPARSPSRRLALGLLGLFAAALTIAPPALAQDEAAADAAPQASAWEGQRYAYVRLSTTLGDMIVELDHDKAPATVENFLSYVNDGYYAGTIFHRVIANFMAQGGGFTTDYSRKPTKPAIQNEADNGLKNVYGTIAMARTGDPHSATSQFFINTSDNAMLDHTAPTSRGWGYCVFGQVIEGLETLEAIRNTPVERDTRVGSEVAAPKEQVVIEKAEQVSPEMCAGAIEFQRKKEAEVAEAERLSAEEAAQRADKLAKLEEELGDAGKALVAYKGHDVSGGKTSESGLWTLDVVEGDGAQPGPTDTVSVHYTGWFTDGETFDSSIPRGEPTSFPLDRVIKGWTEGVGGMKVGGKRFLVVPYQLGYGEAGYPGVIPPKATLVFEVELLKIGA